MEIETDGPTAAPEVVASAEAPAQVDETQSEAAADTGEAEILDNGEESAADTDAEPKKPAKGVQKRLAELTRRIHEERREKERLWAMLERGNPQQTPQRQTPTAQQAQPPREDQFATWEEFEEARIAHAVEQRLDQRLQSERENERNERVGREFSDRVAEFRNEHADYELIVDDLGLVATPLMVAVIRESEVGPNVAYHLGKNLSEARRIAGLPPHRQAAELGKLEDRLGKPPTPAPSLRPVPPAPPQTVSGLSAGLTKSLSDMSMSEYIAARAKEDAS